MFRGWNLGDYLCFRVFGRHEFSRWGRSKRSMVSDPRISALSGRSSEYLDRGTAMPGGGWPRSVVPLNPPPPLCTTPCKNRYRSSNRHRQDWIRRASPLPRRPREGQDPVSQVGELPCHPWGLCALGEYPVSRHAKGHDDAGTSKARRCSQCFPEAPLYQLASRPLSACSWDKEGSEYDGSLSLEGPATL